MIELYFDSLISEENSENEIEITPLIESLSRVIELPEDFDYKKEYRD